MSYASFAVMGLCKNLNCCRKAKPVSSEANNPEKKDDKNAHNGNKGDHVDEKAEGIPNGGEPVYAKVDKVKKDGDGPAAPTSPTSSSFSDVSPVKGAFLVSFVVDSRGGAMTGCRGSGLRVLIPPGAVEQPMRVTCRFVRQRSPPFLPPRPPLRERDALASGIVEAGPAGAKFRLPVLLEIPYFASLGGGERELVVLRSEDGENWQEHPASVGSTPEDGWGDGEEAQLYEDVVNSTDLKAVVDDLETGRIIRLSTTYFPKYLAVLSRIKGEVKAVGPEGSKVEMITPEGTYSVAFPPNALRKRIKIGLQLQKVPQQAVKLLDKDDNIVDVYPLLGIYPRRRKFHSAMEVAIPIVNPQRNSEVKKIWLLCSLSGAHEPAFWEDVSESASVTVRGKHLVFETKVSALFWLITSKREKCSAHDILALSSSLYKELTVSPYLARLTVFYREQFPYAWCDALRVYVCINDRLDGYPESRDAANWTRLIDGREIEVTDKSLYAFECKGGLQLAADCQLEARLESKMLFNAFRGAENALTLLVRWKRQLVDLASEKLGEPLDRSGYLVIKKQVCGGQKEFYEIGSWQLDARKHEEEKKEKDYKTTTSSSPSHQRIAPEASFVASDAGKDLHSSTEKATTADSRPEEATTADSRPDEATTADSRPEEVTTVDSRPEEQSTLYSLP